MGRWERRGKKQRRREGREKKEGGREGKKKTIREGAQAGRQAGVLPGFVSLSGSGAGSDTDTAAADSGDCNIGILGGGPTLPFARDTRWFYFWDKVHVYTTMYYDT